MARQQEGDTAAGPATEELRRAKHRTLDVGTLIVVLTAVAMGAFATQLWHWNSDGESKGQQLTTRQGGGLVLTGSKYPSQTSALFSATFITMVETLTRLAVCVAAGVVMVNAAAKREKTEEEDVEGEGFEDARDGEQSEQEEEDDEEEDDEEEEDEEEEDEEEEDEKEADEEEDNEYEEDDVYWEEEHEEEEDEDDHEEEKRAEKSADKKERRTPSRRKKIATPTKGPATRKASMDEAAKIQAKQDAKAADLSSKRGHVEDNHGGSRSRRRKNSRGHAAQWAKDEKAKKAGRKK